MRDFSVQTRNALARKGITLYGTIWLPGPNGSFTNGERGYKINDNGCGKIWTFSQVLSAAEG